MLNTSMFVYVFNAFQNGASLVILLKENWPFYESSFVQTVYMYVSLIG